MVEEDYGFVPAVVLVLLIGAAFRRDAGLISTAARRSSRSS